MNDYIENLKQKPEHVRKRFAFMVAFSFTFIVFAGWIASYSLKSSPVLADKDSTVDAPVSTITASVIGAYDDIKNIIFGTNEVEYSGDFIEVSGGNR